MKKESGQALLIILLVMAVGLTVALAIVSRSVTDIRISRQEEESARAFSAAEAGLEQALISGEGTYTVGVGDEQISAQVTQVGQGGEGAFIFPGEFQRGDIRTVWLVDHDEDGELDPSSGYGGTGIRLYWGNEGQGAGDDTTPALEATIVYVTGGNTEVYRAAFDPNGARRGLNNFAAADVGSYSVSTSDRSRTFPFRATISPLPGGTLYALRLKLIYNDVAQGLGVEGIGGNFPDQGICLQSVAALGSGITRRVEQCQFYPSPPGIFDYVLFSEGDLSQ